MAEKRLNFIDVTKSKGRNESHRLTDKSFSFCLRSIKTKEIFSFADIIHSGLHQRKNIHVNICNLQHYHPFYCRGILPVGCDRNTGTAQVGRRRRVVSPATFRVHQWISSFRTSACSDIVELTFLLR